MNQLTFALPPKNLREATHEYTLAIKDMPLSEQPINRIQHVGPLAMSTAELLAIVMSARYFADVQHLMKHLDLPGLVRASFHEILAFEGVGPATAARIKAALELGRRAVVARPADRIQVRSPADAAHLLMSEMSILDREEFRVILLDTKNYVIAAPTLYRGSLNTALVRVGEIFQPAISCSAAAIIIAHNHPSGDPAPSPEDVIITGKIVEASHLLDIEVLDHIIIGCGRFVSCKERGLGFN